MKNLQKKSFGAGFMFLFVLIVSLILVKPEKVEAFNAPCPFWSMADRYDRYPCAGPPRDCLIMCPIVVEQE